MVIGNEVEWDSSLRVVLHSSLASSVGNHRWGLAFEIVLTSAGAFRGSLGRMDDWFASDLDGFSGIPGSKRT